MKTLQVALTTLAAGLLLTTSGFAQLPTPTAFYSLNGTVNDSSGNNYNGTVNGTTGYATGILGQQAFQFNGSTTIATTTTDNLGIYNGSFSEESWVNFSNLTGGIDGNSFALFGTIPGGQDEGLQLIVRGDQPYFGFYGDDNGSNFTVTTGTWYNIAYTYNASTKTQTLYVNGNQVGQGTVGNNFQGTGETAYIGGSCCGTDPTGLMQDVGVYNSTLSPTQVQAFFNTQDFVAPAITWTGSQSSIWDSTNGTVTPTQNWVQTFSPSTPSTYSDGDAVTFDNTPGTAQNITIQSGFAAPGGVAPYSVTFNNSTVPYSFTNSPNDANGITGAATVTLSATAGSVTFNSPNTYTGATTISGGSLQINNANSLQNSTAVVNVNSTPSPAAGLVFGPSVGTFNLGGLAGTGNIAMTDTASQPVSLVVGSNGANTVYSGNLTGGGSLTKTGTGVLTLAGANTYAGNTYITNGTLRLQAGSIGLHFGTEQGGGEYALAPTDAAGAPGHVMTNWNNSTGPNGNVTNVASPTAGVLVNSAGVPSGVSVSWTSHDGTFSTQVAPNNADDKLMGSFLNDGTNTGAGNSVTFTNIPYANYEVVSYVGSEGGAQNRDSLLTVTANTTTQYSFETQTSPGNYPAAFNQITNTTAGTYPGGNYAVTTGLSGSTLTVSDGSYPNGANTGLEGVEIINTAIPLPTATNVFIATGSTLDLFGTNQQVTSLNDYTLGSSYGTVVNSAANTVATLTLAPSGTATFTGVIQNGNGTVALTMNGPGTQVLAGANTFSGPTTINGGVLRITNANALQNSTATVNVASAPSPAAGLVFGPSVGTFNLGGLAGAGNLAMIDTGSQPVSLVVGANNTSTSYTGNLTGGGSFTKTGTGVLVLSGQNTYAGSTNITGGTLRLNASAAGQIAQGNAFGIHWDTDNTAPSTGNYTASGQVNVMAPTTVAGVPGFAMPNWNNGVNPTNGAVYSSTTNVASPIPNTIVNTAGVATGVSISWSGGGNWQTGAYGTPNNQLMGTFLNDGNNNGMGNIVHITNIPYSSYEVVAYVGSEGANGRAGDVNIYATAAGINSAPTYYFQTDTSGGNVSPYPFVQITNTTTPLVVNNNAYYQPGNYVVVPGETASNLTVSDGAVGNSNAGLIAVEIINTAVNTLPATTGVNIAGGSTLDLFGGSQQVASLSDYLTPGNGGTVTNSSTGSVTLTLAPTSGSTTFSGVIQNGSGTVGLTFNGAGTQVLAGTNTYTGATNVLNGNLRVNGSLAAGSAVTVAGPGSSGTPTLGGSGTINGPVTINGTSNGVAGTILGASGSSFSLAGGLTLQGGSLSSFALGTPNGTSNALIATSGVTNSLVVNGTNTISFSAPQTGEYDLFSYTGATTFANFQLNSTSISNSPGLTFQLVNGSGQIDLLVTPPPIIWTGATNNGQPNGAAWDYVTANWATSGGASAFYQDPNGVVTFGDNYFNGSGYLPVANSTVYIKNGGVSPALVTFANSGVSNGGVDYTFYDSDGINGIGGGANIVLNGNLPTGAGTVTFMSPNQFTGAVSVNAGYLNIQNGGALGSSAGVAVAAGAVLQLQSMTGGTPMVVGTGVPLAISGDGDGSGALQNVSGANTYAGLITGSGTISSNSNSGSDGLTLTGGLNPQGNTLTITGIGPVTITGTGLSGTSGTVDYNGSNGSNTLTLDALSSFTGLTQIDDPGVFIVTVNGSLNGPLTYNSSATSTINGTLNGAPAVLTDTNGTLILNGANTYGGGTTLSGGTLRAAVSSTVSSGTLVSGALGVGTITLNSGTLEDNGTAITLANSVSLNGNVTLTSSGSGSLTFDGTSRTSPATFVVAGTSSLTVTNTTTINDVISGSANLSLGGTGLLILGGSNTFTGGTTIAPTGPGTVQLNNTNALQNSVVTLNTPGGMTFNSGIGSVALGGLQDGSNAPVNLTMNDLGSNPVALTLGNSNSVGSFNASYSGNLTSTSTLTKVGSNTQTLSGNNSFSGITISGGKLVAGAVSSGTPLGTAPITFSGTSTLSLQGQLGSVQGLQLSFYNFAPPDVNNTSTDLGSVVGAAPNTGDFATVNNHFSSIASSLTAVVPTTINGTTYLQFPGTGANGATQSTGNGNTNNGNAFSGVGFNQATQYEVLMKGSINITTPGTYTFSTSSDDGSVVFINGGGSSPTTNVGAQTVDNNQFQGITTVSGMYTFPTAGSYPIEIGYYQGTGGAGLTVAYNGPDTGNIQENIPNTVLSSLSTLSTATYANNVTLSGSADATIDVSVVASLPTVTMGTLTVNNGANTTLNVTAASAPGGQPYGLTLGAVSLEGNVNINVANNTNGGGNAQGTLTLGSLNDNGTPRTITLGGPGAVTLNTDATSLVQGTVININGGTLNSNSGMAIGNVATVNLAGFATFAVGASQTVSAVNGPSFSGANGVSAGTNLVLGSGQSLTVGSSDNLTSSFGGVISGSGSLVKSGTGTLTLTGVNSYGGGTTVNNGTLRVGPVLASNSSTPLGTGLVQLNGGTLALQGQSPTSYQQGLAGTYYENVNTATVQGNYINSLANINANYGAGPAFSVITTDNTYTTNGNGGGPGGTNPNFNYDNGGENNQFPHTALNNNNISPNGTNWFTSIYRGYIFVPTAGQYSFGLNSDDGSTLFINGALVVNDNNYQGEATTNPSPPQQTGTATLTAGYNSIVVGYYQGNGGYGLNVYYAPGSTAPTGSQELPNSILFNGVLGTPNASQTYVNNVSVTSNSTVNITGSLATTMGDLSINGSTLFVTSSDTSASPYSLTFMGNTGITTLSGNATFNVANSSSGGVGTLVLGSLNDGGTARTITFTDTTDVSAPAAVVTLGSAATSLVAGTVVNVNGTIRVNSNNATALGSAANVNITSAATLNIGASQTLGALNGAGTVNLAANTLTIAGGGTYSGSIADGGAGGGLTLTGGTLILSGTNAYSGATTVNGGSLRINSSLPSTTAVTVGGASATGSPSLGGSGTINGTATVNAAGGGAAGHLAPSGVAATYTTTNFANGLTLNSGTAPSTDGPVLDFNISNSNSDLVNVTGNLSLGSYGILNINPFGGGGNLNAGDYPLIDFTGMLTNNGALSWNVGSHVGDSGHTYSFITLTGTGPGGSNQFDLVVTGGGSITATWSGNTPGSDGLYSTSGNWTPATVPNGAGDAAIFGTGTQTSVSVNEAVTLGVLSFTAPSLSYTLQSSGVGSGLTLNNNGAGGGAQVNVSANVSAILDTPVVLADSTNTTTFDIGAGGSLKIAGSTQPSTAISGSNQAIVLTGGGTLELASPNTYTGSTTINAGTLRIDSGASIGSTSVSIAAGGTLQLAGPTAALPSTANIATHGTGTNGDGAFVMTGVATQTVGTISGDTHQITDGSQQVTVYSGNTTVGDGTHAASLTATQILENTLTINAGSTVTIAPSGSGIPTDAVAAASSEATSDSTADGDSSSDSGSDSSSDPFTAIQTAIASGSISSAKGQQLENRIAAIERLAATDPGLDVSLLEDRVLAALPSSSVWSSSGTSPLLDSGSGLLAVDNSTSGSSGSSLGGSATFAPAAAFGGSPAAVPEPSTLLLAAMGGIGILMAFRRRTFHCEQ